MYFFGVVTTMVILQRFIELRIAEHNRRHLLELGAYEVGAEHYKYIVFLHTAFFLALICEVMLLNRNLPSWWLYTFTIFLLAQVMRIWCLKSLGHFWNTRIFVVPNAPVIKKGPYRFLRHPNYVVVAIELLFLPLTFGAYYTAVVISFLNVVILLTRIKTEEEALLEVTDYQEVMKNTPKFIPLVKK